MVIEISFAFMYTVFTIIGFTKTQIPVGAISVENQLLFVTNFLTTDSNLHVLIR